MRKYTEEILDMTPLTLRDTTNIHKILCYNAEGGLASTPVGLEALSKATIRCSSCAVIAANRASMRRILSVTRASVCGREEQSEW